jgi:probable lipoprotein (TIGR04455 family)
MRSISLFALWAALLSSCAVLKKSTTSPQWQLGDNVKVKRIAVVTMMPEGLEPKAAEVMARVARRYVNLKRDFLVKQERVLPMSQASTVANSCGGDDGIEGVLALRFDTFAAVPESSSFDATVNGALLRCADLAPSWTADAAGRFDRDDSKLVEVIQVYVREMGDVVRRYVAPAHNLLRPLLDALPNPVLTESDKEEKLSLD